MQPGAKVVSDPFAADRARGRRFVERDGRGTLKSFYVPEADVQVGRR